MLVTFENKLGLRVLYESERSRYPSGPLVDVVAIHGIGADPDRTWTSNGVNWLRDETMLPHAIPQARIMRFGYESQWLGHEAIQQRLPLVADQLLRSLVGLRAICSQRPLVFIGHCFGGIVIEKALLSAKLHQEDYPNIIRSTAGVIFLGTPHRGSESQSKASLIATIASAVDLGQQSPLIQVIEKDSEMLMDLVHDFTRAANILSIQLFCFFEQQKSDIAKVVKPMSLWPTYKTVVVDERSGTLDGFPKLGLACDHFQMNRSGGPDDSNYRYVHDEVVRLVQFAPSRIAGRLKRSPTDRVTLNNKDDRDQACLQAIFVTDPLDDMQMIENKKDRIMDRTGSWIFSDSAFSRWLNSETSALLWLHGDPGKGKTMLAISLVRELTTKIELDGSNDKAMLAYFFCDNKDDRRRTGTTILRGLIYQILCQRPELSFHLRSEYERQKEHLLNSPNTLHTLWRIFKNITVYPNIETLYVIIDALDECDPESADSLLALLEPYLNSEELPRGNDKAHSSRPTCHVKFLLTSRNEISIRQRLSGALEISLEQNSIHVEEAVHKFVDLKVKQLRKSKRYDDKLAAFVQEHLLEKAQGTFLWAALACRELSKPTVRLMQTRAILLKLPSGIMPLYDRITEQILNNEDEEMAEYAKTILDAMVVAQRPFTLKELAVVADLPKAHLDEIEVLEDFVGLCGSMVDVRDGTVYFVHISARDYLLSTKSVISTSVEASHQKVAINCFSHLCDFSLGYGDDLSEPRTTKSVRYDRLEYPILFWLDHVKHAPQSISDKIHIENDFFRSQSNLREEWFNAYWEKKHARWEERPSDFAALHLASYAGLPWLVSALLSPEKDTVIDITDSHGNTPLIWAARMGSAVIALDLVTQGAKVAAKNRNGLTALFFAASHGHKDVVQLLTEKGASVQVTDSQGWTPLHRAVDQGYTDIVTCLLHNGANIEARDHGTWTVLYRAVSSGQLEVVKILLEQKANTEVPDREGMTLLQTAAWNGHEHVVSLLLKYHVNIEARDREGWTALHHASWNGHATVVGILLRNGADVDVKNHEENTPLYHATWNGHAAVVQLLVQYGADVNGIFTEGETALQQAAWRGHLSVARILLDAGAEPNSKSALGSTALHQAASNGQEAIIKLLLDSGADPLSETEDGQTPFDAAKENSYYELARYIESRGGYVPDDQEEANESGMDERRIGLDVDPAITKIIGFSPSSCKMQDHGDACSSTPMKITAFVNGETKYYFVKLGPIGEMFKGEHASLQALHSVVPLICPVSLGHGKLTQSPGHFLLTEFLDINDRTTEPGSGLSFVQKLALLHSAPAPVPEGHNQPMFGFPITTYAGRTKQDNTFRRSWAKFYAENRLRTISRLIEEAHGADDELSTWIERTAADIVPKLLGNGHLGGKRGISPVLVHGDLWSGNKGRGRLGGKGGIEDITFDASCCYAHSEYELGLMRAFGGFSAGFFSEYHRLIPKTEPQNEYEDRMKLYQIYHWLNNWALFRGGYRDDAMDCMQELYAKYEESEET